MAISSLSRIIECGKDKAVDYAMQQNRVTCLRIMWAGSLVGEQRPAMHGFAWKRIGDDKVEKEREKNRPWRVSSHTLMIDGSSEKGVHGDNLGR